ncbi:MAG: MBL fold metallo-hydrolase [Rhodocyclaceae bacterium]|nr:MBL fold metallo-hydrolase [Rhodocyclaceae bacterium]MCP5231612.1 MBL fold metallo-hydrolase [Zoogloeaceae bacterium]MCP5254825.1 MBL fold metallo-hydrolase [Zoogloeaceae bacterium]MCP5294457.1 MBL fold metallo-hydrolase [Zoogloeaceae bacterium]MCW5613553.1 MBL fold metallo-hydrolase [Rhodocyclaceae bacterium]
MKICFHGAAGEVTGSCYEVRHDGGRFLVDCGMFQGGREADGKNRRALGFDVRQIDFVLVTHAHIDHSGLLPRLFALGYEGPVICTDATADLLEVMLRDAAHIQEKEAEWRLRRQRRRGAKRIVETAPIYTVAQAEYCLRYVEGHGYDEKLTLDSNVEICFRDAGHILGSAIVEIWLEASGVRRKLVFSGDLGQPDRPILRDPTPIADADCLWIESTYGDRLHRAFDATRSELIEALHDVLQVRHGNVIIPAFAVGRTQEILVVLAELVRSGDVQPLQVYVDSPMATAVTELTMRHENLWDDESKALQAWWRDNPERFKVRFVSDVEESKALNQVRSGAVVISASGMCDAGRIKHHLKYNLSRPECAIVIAGFQAAGTLGRRLVDGARLVRLFGEPVVVKASIHTIGGLSAHADQAALMSWLRHFSSPPKVTFVVHGEQSSARTFAELIEHDLQWNNVTMPAAGECIALDAALMRLEQGTQES